MPVFWLFFWAYFLIFPALFGLSRLIKSKGSGTSQTHRWVDAKSGRKHRDASVREVWEHNNPGKSWVKTQNKLANGCLVFLILFILVMSIPMIPTLISGMGTGSTPSFLNYVAPVLGALCGAGYFFLFTKGDIIPGPDEIFFLFLLDLLSFLCGAVFIVGGIALTLSGRDLPFSHHWIWLPVLMPLAVIGVLYLLSLGGKREKKRKKGSYTPDFPARPPDKLSTWSFSMIMKLIEVGSPTPPAKTKNLFKFHADNLLNLGSSFEMSDIVADRNFFLETEGLLLALARREQINITVPMVFEAREDLIRAAQVIYLYGINHGGYTMSPALKKFFTP